MSLQLVQHSAWQLLLQRSLIPFLCAEISLVGVSDLTPFPVGAGAGRSVLETCPGAGRGGSPRAAVPDPGGSGRALAPSLPDPGQEPKAGVRVPPSVWILHNQSGH